jgi:TldD protein
MKEIGSLALDTAKLRGATHAEARIVDERRRAPATRNGRIGSASDSESLGIGVRVIADGSFGFAATDDFVRASGEESIDMVVPLMTVREFNLMETTKF